MFKSVWRLDLHASLVHELPMGAQPLHADYNCDGHLCVWMLVEPSRRKLEHGFLVAGTGWQLPEYVTQQMHIHTAQNKSAGTVWHIFDLGYLENYKPFDRRSIQMLQEQSEQEGGADASE